MDYGPAAVGGDFYWMGNFEYRIPIAGPLSISPFLDIGTVSVFKEDQLKVYGPGTSIVLLPSTNNVLRSSVGLEMQFLLAGSSSAVPADFCLQSPSAWINC